jgi:Cu-Zn family superoxide dismutase
VQVRRLPVKKVTMNLVTSQGVGQAIGTVTIAETAKGWSLRPI